ncbi:MAG: alpha/beta hydrolase [Actinobacteria bacterium]|nr:alpha/beta hydrolase [Actinomycetota bacterium]
MADDPGRHERPESRWVDIDGPVHYVDHGGPADAPLLVCIHGLGGSLVNWAALAPLLQPRCRVMALDLAGFGHTQGGARSTSVHANQRLLDGFLRQVAGTPAILVGNSMGGLISILQAHDSPGSVAGLVLIDPALPVGPLARPDPRVVATFAALAIPAVGRRLLALRRSTSSAEEAANDILRLCCADASRVPEHVVEQHIEVAAQRRDYGDVDAELLSAARSLLWVLADRARYGAMQRAITAPVLLLHGDRDRLVPIASARATAKSNPSWRFEVAEGVGHVPQLEVPEWTAERILAWLLENPQCVSAAAAAEPGWRALG